MKHKRTNTTVATAATAAANPYPPRRRALPVPKQIRWAAEVWMDIFHDTLLALLNPEARLDENITRVKMARTIADLALEECEERWPEVRV